jgi:FAD/FMN-containing dehydrogenase
VLSLRPGSSPRRHGPPPARLIPPLTHEPWACTIGGNIAENAGGKDCVLWGTCIDNIVSFRIAMPSGSVWTVRRANHQLRKILPEDLVRFEVTDEAGMLVRAVELRGSEIRKKGLWKDITNKALGGLPGVQKEGTDGVIASAEFILYRAYPHARTLCLEFFGPSFDEASEVIQQIARAMLNRGEEALSALEHFDDEYVRAIAYKTKAPRPETPRAVLLVDVVGHAPEQVDRGLEHPRAPGRPPQHPPHRGETPPRPGASGPTASSSAPSPAAPTPSSSTRTWSCRSPRSPSSPASWTA